VRWKLGSIAAVCRQTACGIDRQVLHDALDDGITLRCRRSANRRHMQRSKLQFYSITSSAHFPVSNTSTSLGPQMTKWLSLGSRCAAASD
jgi:hypothetical protein